MFNLDAVTVSVLNLLANSNPRRSHSIGPGKRSIFTRKSVEVSTRSAMDRDGKHMITFRPGTDRNGKSMKIKDHAVITRLEDVETSRYGGAKLRALRAERGVGRRHR